MDATDLLLWGIVAHLIADWLLANDWTARNKHCLTHPASWVHQIPHVALTALVFPPVGVVFIVAMHMLIDTRRPLLWYRRAIRQTMTGEYAPHIAIWTDQVAHVAVIAVAALLVTI